MWAIWRHSPVMHSIQLYVPVEKVCKLIYAFEYTAATPPKPHTCETNWKSIGDYCYYFGSNPTEVQKTWHDARQWCNANSGDLVSITSIDEDKAIAQAVSCSVYRMHCSLWSYPYSVAGRRLEDFVIKWKPFRLPDFMDTRSQSRFH